MATDAASEVKGGAERQRIAPDTSRNGLQMPGAGITKVSFNLPTEVVEELRDTAREQGITVTQLLRNAIALQLFVNKELQQGSTMLFEKPDGRVREVVFR